MTIPARLAPPVEVPTAPQPEATPVLTTLGASRALEAIGKNQQIRGLFMRLSPSGSRSNSRIACF